MTTDWTPDPRTLEWAAREGRHGDEITHHWLMDLARAVEVGNPADSVTSVHHRRKLAQEATR